ncbi:polysaccharide deacetylase family protein [Lacticaseibacillus camelliae]|uniref:polysaccharide deacetylase family protein n=1 Tax=Lacticaseibacillus camelliae TaxID=381742 RepID=UPI0012E188CF|nr:polysaccharide deacetylase family protein [Lacticaseibacillus camelliae]
MTATNFKLTAAALTITAAAGQAVATVPYPKLAPYLKGATPHAPAGKLIALTFDDGPNPQTTPSILKTLAAVESKPHFSRWGLVLPNSRLWPKV